MVRSAARRCFSYAGAGQLQRHCAGTRPPRIVDAVFYQTTVREPRGWHDQRVVLRFDSATRKEDVWVGDTHVAHHEGGYLPLEADVTDLVAPGEEVRITGRVDNRLRWHTIPPGYVEDTAYAPVQRQMHDFFNYAGIHRRVWLYSTPVNYLDDITVVTDIEKSEADAEVRGLVSCRASISNVHDADEYRHRALPDGFRTQTSLLTLRAALLGPDGTEAGRADSVGVDAKGLEYTFDIKVKNPILWELGEGGHCDLLIEVCDADDVIDSCTVRVGIRTVDVVGHEFHINGKPFYFPGFGMHEDHGTIGKGHSDALMVHDFELLSWIGANSLRTSHYPYAEEVLDYADEHGVVVIDEAAAVGMNKVVGATFGGKIDRVFGPDDVSEETQAAHAAHLSELVARDKYHPSVVMWSIANEPESHTEESEAYFAPLLELTRRLDPTRPVEYVNVQFSPASEDRLATYSGVLMINRYYGWYTQTGHIPPALTLSTRS